MPRPSRPQEQTAQQLQEEFGHRGLTFPPRVVVYRVEGPFFFGAVENFERALASTHTDPEVVILRLRWVPCGHNGVADARGGLRCS